MKILARIFVLVTVSFAPLLAQGGGRAGGPPATRQDSVRRTPTGTVIDFQDQDIAVVLRAVAEAGDLPVTMMQLPSARVTLRVQAQMTRETALEMLKSIAEANAITVTESPSLIRLVGPPPAPRTPTTPTLSPAQQLAQALANRQLVLYTHRLKHATATTLAPILMNVLTGTGGIGGRGATFPAGINLNPNQGRGGQNQQQQNQGGRGGRGGDAVTVLPQVILGDAAGRGGAAGGGRAGQAIQELQAQIAQGLGQAFGIQVGGPTTTAAQLAFTDMRIVAEESTNSLIIRGTTEDIQQVLQLVQSVDVRPLQVLIEVTIAQVERSSDLNVGLSTVSSRTTRSGVGAAAESTKVGIELPAAATARDFIAILTGNKGSVDYDVAINALHVRGDVRVLSLPIIIAQNNRQAIINVGARVPFVQVSQTVPNDPTGRVETIQYQDVGTQLQITPIINTDGYVNMAVVQTADNLTNNVQFDAQIISTRQAQTQVMVRDGQTTVLGGLADNTSSNSRSGIPFLSRIPLIGGWLFGNTQKNKTVTELYLFLTPHIVSSDEDIDRLRESIRGTSDLLKGVPLRRINAAGDTINIGVPDSIARRLPPIRRDTGRKEPPDSVGPFAIRNRLF